MLQRIAYAIACVAALTSSWTSLQAGPVEIGDLALIGAFIISVLARALGPSRDAGFPYWSLVPAVVTIALAWYGTVVLGFPFGQPVEVLKLGTGVAPATFLIRVTISSALVAAFLFNLAAVIELHQLFQVLRFYVASLVVNAGYAALQAADINPLAPVQTQLIGFDRYPGLATHPNALAQAAVLAACVLAGLPMRSLAARIFTAVSAVGCGYAVLVSGSRAGLITALLIVLALALRVIWSLFGGPLRLAVVGICAVIFVYGAVAISSTSRLGNRDASAVESDRQRAQSINAGIDWFAASPFTGSGLGIWLGESVPIVLLSSGGLLLFAAYAWWVLRAGSMALRVGAAWAGLRWTTGLVFCSLAILWTLNNNVFERYTLWPILAMAFIWQLHGRSSPAAPVNAPRLRDLVPERSGRHG